MVEKEANELKEAALKYHEFPEPGKFTIKSTKAMNNQKDLSLAYSPGVAFPC
jgi:malate dehydrogenase (oxaloacetate-decarboxylating)(NADP+)